MGNGVDCQVSRKCRRMQSESAPYLSVSELGVAESKIISLVQQEVYPNEYAQLSNDEVKRPTPLMYQLGLYKEGELIKCKGRLHQALLREPVKNPILLPSKHEVTKMIVESAHRSCQHYGVGYVVAYLRHKYWIPRLRQVVKGVQYRGITCKRLQGKKYAEVPDPPFARYKSTTSSTIPSNWSGLYGCY